MNSKNQWLIDIGNNDDLWANNLEEIPSMICYAYRQLKTLAIDGNVYGVLLQCKDVYENALRIPVIMAIIIIDSDPKYKDCTGYSAAMKKLLEKPMSMGLWFELSGIIVKKNKEFKLPENLVRIIRNTRKLYNEEISENASDVVNWRNDNIGHGSLKFEDDISYQKEVKKLIEMLSSYFDGEAGCSISGLYSGIYFKNGDDLLIGSNLDTAGCYCSLYLYASEKEYSVSNYLYDQGIRLFLFDSFYSRKGLMKYSSYADGWTDIRQSRHFTDLFQRYVLKGGQDFNLNSGFMSREEAMMLEYFNMPPDYVKPEYLIRCLEEKMESTEKGIITIQMERGTGKSAFANNMDGLYHKNALIPDCFSRCYHVQNALLRGASDFVNAVNLSFTRSYDYLKDIGQANDEMKMLSLGSSNPAKDMADFLNYYHEKYDKECTVLVIDGIDEIVDSTRVILDFIPEEGLLDEGVFIILLSRFGDENTIDENRRQYIEHAETIANAIIPIRRKDTANIDVLKSFISSYSHNSLIKHNNEEFLIEKSDYRILYLKAYLELDSDTCFDVNNESEFIEAYINYVMMNYGNAQREQIIEFAVAIALLGELSIKQYQEYVACQELSYSFIGCINDLLPVLTTERKNDDTFICFANQAYSSFVLRNYESHVEKVIVEFGKSLEIVLTDYLGNMVGYLLRQVPLSYIEGFDEAYLNKSIMFYAEGIASVWSAVKNKPHLLSVFSNNTSILELCSTMQKDSWAQSGYGLMLKNNIEEIILELLSLSLTEGDTLRTWGIHAHDMFSRPKDKQYYTPYLLMKSLSSKSGFDAIYEYIIHNCSGLDLKYWFWLVSIKPSKEAMEVIKRNGMSDEFADYMITSNFMTRRWASLILNSGVSNKQEEKLFNYELESLAQIINKSGRKNPNYDNFCNAMVLISQAMEEKGYTISDNDSLILIRAIKDGDADNRSQKLLEDATSAFLDFGCKIDEQIDRRKVYHRYSIALYELKKTRKNAEFIKFFENAVYKRMLYEYESGCLYEFVENEIGALFYFDHILKSCFDSESERREALYIWINRMLPISGRKRCYSNLFLSRLMIILYKKLLYRGCKEEALKMLEEMVRSIDTQAFFSSLYLSRIVKKKEPSEVYGDNDVVLSTDNALILLRKYKKSGCLEKYERLMQKIEQTTEAIYHEIGEDSYEKALIEKQINRFARVRVSLGYCSEFDDFLEELLTKKETHIKTEIPMLNRNSDYNAISFEIESLIECLWQRNDWAAGEKCCNRLIDTLSVSNTEDNIDNEYIAQFVNEEAKKIQGCKRLFMFMQGKNVTWPDERVHYDSFDKDHRALSCYTSAYYLSNATNKRSALVDIKHDLDLSIRKQSYYVKYPPANRTTDSELGIDAWQ